MARLRTTMKAAPLWPDPSQVFSDTQRVDLFNDPRWESPPDAPARRLPPDPSAPARRLSGPVAYWRAMTKRGQHSRSGGGRALSGAPPDES